MPKGGARNRSGPAPDPRSERSERRGYSLSSLPAEGYDGEAPEFPLPDCTERELEVWEAAWRTPQACAWSMPSESWRVRLVAMWVRVSVRAEAQDAPATLITALPRLEDKIGFSDAGLAAMGWKIATDELGAKRATKPAEPDEAPVAPVRRLRG